MSEMKDAARNIALRELNTQRLSAFDPANPPAPADALKTVQEVAALLGVEDTSDFDGIAAALEQLFTAVHGDRDGGNVPPGEPDESMPDDGAGSTGGLPAMNAAQRNRLRRAVFPTFAELQKRPGYKE
jgi:hypothetical protein